MYLCVIKKEDVTSYAERAKSAMKELKTIKKYGDFLNEQSFHRMICDMAGGCKRVNNDLLYLRIGDKVYLQSNQPFNKQIISDCGYQIEFETEMTNYDITDNSFVEITCKLAPTVARLKRKVSIINSSDREVWVRRKMSDIGATAILINEIEQEHIMWSHHKMYSSEQAEGWVKGFLYRILVHVQDAEKFTQAIQSGIGRNKAYGCGMLLCRPIKR